MPKVTIGVPVYNGGAFLAEALASLCAQSYGNIEIVVCDNASTDDTEAICRSFVSLDPRVRYIRHPSNVGASRNYNRTLELSRGEFFKWAAHDDLCAPTLVESCLAELERRPGAVLAYPRTVVIDETGERLCSYDDGLNLLSPRPSERFRDYLFRSAQECNAVFGLIRSPVLKRTDAIGAFNASDRALLAHLALLGEIVQVPEELFFRRDHGGTSLRANRTAAAVAAWFDPVQRRKVVLPNWRLFREFFRLVRRSPMALPERGLCLLHLVRGMWRKRARLRTELGTVLPERPIPLPRLAGARG